MTKQEYIDKVVSSYPLDTYKGEALKELVRVMEVVYDEGKKNWREDYHIVGKTTKQILDNI